LQWRAMSGSTLSGPSDLDSWCPWLHCLSWWCQASCQACHSQIFGRFQCFWRSNHTLLRVSGSDLGILEISANCFDRVLQVKGFQEAGLGGIPVILVYLKSTQAVQQGLGLVSQGGGQFLNFSLVVLCGNFCSSHNSFN
jgi:hypothetical protein